MASDTSLADIAEFLAGYASPRSRRQPRFPFRLHFHRERGAKAGMQRLINRKLSLPVESDSRNVSLK